MVRKKLVVIMVGLCLVLFFVHSGNAQSVSKKVVKLKFADMSPSSATTIKSYEWWASEIEKRTKGQVKFEYYWGGSLIGAKEQLSAVMNNVIQVTPYYSGYHPDIAPIPSIALFPMMNLGSLETSSRVSDEFYRTNQEVQNEFKRNRVKYMSVPNASCFNYFWSKVPIKSTSDFKGLTVRTFGPFLTFFKALGSNVVSLSLPETYNALERGLVKGTLAFLTVAVGDHVHEVTNYLIATDMGHNCGKPVVMNLDTWNSLPEDTKKVIDGFDLNEKISKYGEIEKETFVREMKAVKDKGLVILELSASDVETLKEIAREKVWEPYAKELEKKGTQGNKALQHYLTLVDKYKSLR